ncbi:hypothetical protein C8R45DRAFT_1223710 [Mycena sanguinolenta]|nr:hypothetical protein C8R45DRAFT_1223710 [Mycena sanguinolenta]
MIIPIASVPARPLHVIAQSAEPEWAESDMASRYSLRRRRRSTMITLTVRCHCTASQAATAARDSAISGDVIPIFAHPLRIAETLVILIPAYDQFYTWEEILDSTSSTADSSNLSTTACARFLKKVAEGADCDKGLCVSTAAFPSCGRRRPHPATYELLLDVKLPSDAAPSLIHSSSSALATSASSPRLDAPRRPQLHLRLRVCAPKHCLKGHHPYLARALQVRRRREAIECRGCAPRTRSLRIRAHSGACAPVHRHSSPHLAQQLRRHDAEVLERCAARNGDDGVLSHNDDGLKPYEIRTSRSFGPNIPTLMAVLFVTGHAIGSS